MLNISTTDSKRKKRKNNGGLLGGLGYVGGSIAAGVGGIVEGIVDLGAAGIALLGGDKEYAKYVFKDNVVGDWHQSLTDNFNPGGFNKFVGDVFQGVGQSATMLIPYVGVPAFFLGVGSQGISGAAEKTGNVGFKEVAYGVTSGLVEGGLEWAFGAAGQGAKSIASAIAKKGGTGAVKTVLSGAVRKGLAGKVLSSAAGEFLEESASEIIDVGLQKMYRIDPNAQLSGKDILYSGVVGAFSGGVMGGSVSVVQTLNNRAAGQKVIRDGNAQTLVNTANLVADKLAGQGTNFRKAPEWVKTLRGEIDAYNKLAEKGEQNSAKGETILGEMKASLFFAETQAIHYGVTEAIKTSSEENRATLAEYINQTIEKKKRPRNYTADDIAKDTDGIATQLGIMQMAGDTFINYADALASLEADQAQESVIGDVINKTRAESDTAESEQQSDNVKIATPVTNVETKATSGIFNASVKTEQSANAEVKNDLVKSKRDIARAQDKSQGVPPIISTIGANTSVAPENVGAAGNLDTGSTVEGVNQEQSAESKKTPDTVKIRKPKEALTDVQRQERATERAQKLIEREKEATPTVKELNTAREAVKDFDNMPQATKASVVKMIRSADGKVDSQTVKGISNLMTLRRRSGALVMPNVEIRFADIGKNSGGLYTHIGEGENKKTVILVNPTDSFKKTIRGTIAHEVVHYIENRKGYRELADYVLKTAKAEKIAEIEKEYNEHYKAIYTDEAEAEGLAGDAVTKKVAERMATEDYKALIDSEVVAKLIGLRLNNEKFLKKYATKDDAMIKKIFRFLSASVSYLKDKDKATADEVTKLVNMFDGVLGAREVKDAGEQTKTAKYATNSTSTYDFTKPFYKQVDDYIDGKFPKGDALLLGGTPKVYQDIGFNALPMTINQKHVDYALNGTKNADHDIGEILLKYLPTAIQNPIAVITSNSEPITSVVAIISITHNGKQIIAPVYIEGVSKQYGIIIDSNVISSAHARGNAITSLLKNALYEESNGNIGLFYWDKKRAEALLSEKKVTMPNGLNTLSDGYIHSIRESGSPVKPKLQNVTESQQFKRWFGKSKAVEADGTPKILYHQTGEDFEIFDPRHKGAGTNDDETPFGIFMKPADNDIGLKGKKQMALYARIVNPLVVNDRADLVHKLKSFSSKYADLIKQRQALSVEYQKKIEDAGNAWSQYAKEYRKNHPDATRAEIYEDETFKKLYDAEDILTEEWIEKADKLSLQMKDEITNVLKAKNFDGVILKNDAGSGGRNVETYIALEPTQVKSATDNIGTFDKANPNIKYDLAPGKAEKKIEKLEKEKAEAQAKAKQERSMREKLAREAAQVAKAEAAKVYTKKEIEGALKDVEALTNAEILSLAKGLELKGMTKARRDELISKIYILLHSASAQGEAGRGSVAIKTIATKIAWDVIDTSKIYDENGKAMHIVDVYDEASVEGIATYLTDTLYQSFANMGEHTSNSYFQAEMRKVKENFNREFINDRKLQRFTREASFQGTQLRQLAETQKRNMEDEGIQKVTKLLGSIVDNKGNIRIGKVDEAMAEADRFYSSEGGKLYSEQKEADKATLTEFAWESDGDIQFMIEEFIRLRKGREGKFLNATEMEYLAKVMGGLKTMIKRYNKAYIDGHWVDIDEKAQESAVDLKKFSTEREYKNKLTKWLSEKADKYLQGAYFYNVLSPETVVETLEGFKKNGVLKTLYHTVRVATQKAEHLSVQLKKPFAEFIDDKKNVWEDEKGKKHTYRNKLNKKAISINGAEITLGEAIYLYMLTKREQAHAGLTESGYVTYDDEGKRKLKIKIEDVERTRDMIAAQLDAADREFLKMADEFFNKTSTDIKYNADMEIFGYSNIQDGYYVPIIRDRYSRMQGVTDQRQSVGSIITVYNKSFNQNTVENAKALEGQNILRIINDHADGLADYSELYLPLKSFDRVYNRKIVLEGGEITSIREVLNNEVWTGAQGYFKKLFADIQGQGSERGFLDGMIGKLRSGWVNSVLGANVKVVATQTTSYVAANQLIEAKYLSAAASKFVGNIDEIRERAYKYSDIIEARNFEMGSLRAQGNIDKVNEIGKKSGFLIGWMDERICLSIFHAAELKAEAQGHGAVGTESNSIAAAKIADEVIYTTQAMTSQAERSALQRSKSEVAKTLSMFTSDSVKQLSHLYRNVMQFVAHKQRAKSDTAYEAELSKDAKMIVRSAATVLTTGIMLGLITQAFKYLYAQEEEEPEERRKDFAIDMVSSTLNIMPIVSDIADKFVFGYDLSLNVFDIVNDTIEDTSALFKMTGKAMGGQYVSNAEVGKTVINAVKTYTTLFGVPLAPVERTVTGLMRRFTPSAVYGYDAMFSNPAYTADLKKAVEKGDEQLAEHILGQLYKNEVTGVYTSEELEIVADLYSKGYTSVIPQKIGESVNDVKLTKKQRQQFNKIYSQASTKVNEMIATAEFKELSEEQQAKAIKNLYSLYYNRAASEITGKEISNAQMYSWFTDNYSALFTSQAYKSGLDVVKDSKGKEISVRDQFVEYAQNLGLSEGDYLVVAFANGVRDKKTKAAFIEHINSLKLTNDQKSVIAEKLSLELKDGKLVEKKE